VRPTSRRFSFRKVVRTIVPMRPEMYNIYAQDSPEKSVLGRTHFYLESEKHFYLELETHFYLVYTVKGCVTGLHFFTSSTCIHLSLIIIGQFTSYINQYHRAYDILYYSHPN